MAGPHSMPLFRDSRDRFGMFQRQPGPLEWIGAPSLGAPGFPAIQHPPFPFFAPRFDGDDDDIGPFHGGGLHSPFRAVAAQHHHERVLAAAALRRGMHPAPEPLPPFLPNGFMHTGPGPVLRREHHEWDGVEMFRTVDDPGRFVHQPPIVPVVGEGEFVRGGILRNRFPSTMKVKDAVEDVKMDSLHARGNKAQAGEVDELGGKLPRNSQQNPQAIPPLLERPPGFQASNLKASFSEQLEPPGFERVSPPRVEHSNAPSLKKADPVVSKIPSPPTSLEVQKVPGVAPPKLRSPEKTQPLSEELPPGFEFSSRLGVSDDQSSRRPEESHVNEFPKRPVENTPKERSENEDENSLLRSRKLARISDCVPGSSPELPSSFSKNVKKASSKQAKEPKSKPESVKSRNDDDEPEEGQLTPPASPTKLHERRDEFGVKQVQEHRATLASAGIESVRVDGKFATASPGNKVSASILESPSKLRPTPAKANGPTKFDRFRTAIMKDDSAMTIGRFRTPARENQLMKVDKFRRFASSRELSMSHRDKIPTPTYRDQERGLPRIEGDTIPRVEPFSSGLPSVQRKGLRRSPIDYRHSDVDGDDCKSTKFQSERGLPQLCKGERDYNRPRYKRSQTLDSRMTSSPPSTSRSSRFGNMRMDSPSVDRQRTNPHRSLQPHSTKRSSDGEDSLSGIVLPIRKRGRLTSLDSSRDRSVERGASPDSLGKEHKIPRRFRPITDHFCVGSPGRDRLGTSKKKGFEQSSTAFQDIVISPGIHERRETPSPIQSKPKVSLRSPGRRPTSHHMNREHRVMSDRFDCESKSELDRDSHRHPGVFASSSGLPGIRSERSPPRLRSVSNGRQDDHRLSSMLRSLPVFERKSPSLSRLVTSFDYSDRIPPKVREISASSSRTPERVCQDEKRRINCSGAESTRIETPSIKLNFQSKVDSHDNRRFMLENSNKKRESLSSKRRLEPQDERQAVLSHSWNSGMEFLSKSHLGPEALEFPSVSKQDAEHFRSCGDRSFREPRISSQLKAHGQVVKPLPKIISTGHKKDDVPVTHPGRLDRALDSPVLNKPSPDDHRLRKGEHAQSSRKEGTVPTSSNISSLARARSSSTNDGHEENVTRPRSACIDDTSDAAIQFCPLDQGIKDPSSMALLVESPHSLITWDASHQLDASSTPASPAPVKGDTLFEMNLSFGREEVLGKAALGIPHSASSPAPTAPPRKAVFLFGANLNAPPAEKRPVTSPSKKFETQDTVIHSQSTGTASLDADKLNNLIEERRVDSGVQNSQDGLQELCPPPALIANAGNDSVDRIASDFRSPAVVHTLPSDQRGKSHDHDVLSASENGQNDVIDFRRHTDGHNGDEQGISEQEDLGVNDPTSHGRVESFVEVNAPSEPEKLHVVGHHAELLDVQTLPITDSVQELGKASCGAIVHAVVSKDLNERSKAADRPKLLNEQGSVVATEHTKVLDEQPLAEISTQGSSKETSFYVDSTLTPATEDTKVLGGGGDQNAAEGNLPSVQATVTINSAANPACDVEKGKTLPAHNAEDVKSSLTLERKILTPQNRPKSRNLENVCLMAPIPLDAPLQKDKSLSSRGPASISNARQGAALQGAGAHIWRRHAANSSPQTSAATFRASRAQVGAAPIQVMPKMVSAPSYVRKGNSLVRASGTSNVRPASGDKSIAKHQSGQVRPVAKQRQASQSHLVNKFPNRSAFLADTNTAYVPCNAVPRNYIAHSGGSGGVHTSAASSAATLPESVNSKDDVGTSTSSVASVVVKNPSIVQKVVTTTGDVINTSQRMAREHSTAGCQFGNSLVNGKLDDRVNEHRASVACSDVGSERRALAVTSVSAKAVPSATQNDVAGSRLYVRRKANQLVVAPPHPSSAGLIQTEFGRNHPERALSMAGLYVKRKTNQLVRKHSGKSSLRSVVQGFLGKSSPKFQQKRVGRNGIVSKKMRLEAAGKNDSRRRSSWVWTLDGGTVARSGNFNAASLQGPRLLPWKRQNSLPKTLKQQRLSFSLPEGNKRSLLFVLSKRLRKVRPVQPVYTRSANGFSLHRSGVMSLGGGNLKWTKSLEEQAKQASEEVTKAVAEAERQKRKFQEVAGETSAAAEGGRRVPRKGSRGEGEKIVWVGMERYKMDASSNTLQRIPGSQGNDGGSATVVPESLSAAPILTPRRSVIGGTMYVRVGNGNQLVRDPKAASRALASEKVRWSLHNARFRNAKKQQYCQFFTRFGKCNRETGKCPYTHDPEKVAVCTKFLNGSCTNDSCLLTHKENAKIMHDWEADLRSQILPERMPDCSFFLEGLCTNENCPYRHVSVNPKAPYCDGFLRGYCNDGDKCNKKHTYVCATYVETGECSDRASCRFHHPKKKSTATSQAGATGRKSGIKRKRRYFSVDDEPLAMNPGGNVGIANESSSIPEADDSSLEFISLVDSDADEDQKGKSELWQKQPMPATNTAKDGGKMSEEIEKRIKPTFLLQLSRATAAAAAAH